MATLEALIEQLYHPRDWRVRESAVIALAELNSEQAIDAIIEALYDESPHVVQTATGKLRHFGNKAVPGLLEALYSPEDIASRPFIIHALRKLGDQELVPHFIHFLDHANPEMQYAAAVALSKVPDKRAVQPLLNALDQTNPNRNEIIEALAAIGDPTVVPYVGAYLSDDHYTTCNSTAILLGKAGTSEAQNMLLEASRHERSDVRKAAVKGLGIINNDETYQRVVELVDDPDVRVREISIMTLGKTRREEAVPLLLSLLKTSDHRRMYLYLRAALGDTGDLRVVLPLLEGFRQDHEHDGRGLSRLSEVVWEYQSRGAEVLPSVIEAMGSEDVRLQISAVWVFHTVSFKYAPPTEVTWVNAQLAHLDRFMSLLHNQNPDVRLAALVCLSEAALPKLTDTLIRCLDDDDPLIQEMAAKALGFINTHEVFDALSQLTNRTNANIRRQAINSLVRLGGDKVVSVLLSLLEHEDKWTRRLAAYGLGSMKSRASVPYLIQRLHNETDPTAKSAIIWSLGDIGDPVAVPEIVRILDSEDDGIFTDSPFDVALYALQMNNSEAALSSLYRVVNEGSRWQRRVRAVEAISRIGSDRDVADRMFELLGHENDTVRTTASKELGYLGARTGDLDLRDYIVSNLINRLRDTGAGYHWSPTVAHMAAKSLYYVGTTEAIQALKAWEAEGEIGEENNE